MVLVRVLVRVSRWRSATDHRRPQLSLQLKEVAAEPGPAERCPEQIPGLRARLSKQGTSGLILRVDWMAVEQPAEPGG